MQANMVSPCGEADGERRVVPPPERIQLRICRQELFCIAISDHPHYYVLASENWFSLLGKFIVPCIVWFYNISDTAAGNNFFLILQELAALFY